tara:strand:+ start:314 stop:1111 length:798 start_codon:yes stop_codon:yes gene_type:complete
MKISFTKAHATGNDFVIIYKNDNMGIILTCELIELLCNRKYGIGADGLLFIDSLNGYDFKLDYYNNDGSWETLCANGVRCAALFMFERKLISANATILCGDGPHKIKIEGNLVSTSMKLPVYKTDTLCVYNYKGRYVDSGAKHFAILVDSVNNIDVERDGSAIRYNDLFLPDGINVNFYSIDKSFLCVRTYEKGVESEMLSCGSGSVACAYDAFKKGLISPDISIKVKGGELKVMANYELGDVWLSGSATMVYNGQINYEEINGK